MPVGNIRGSAIWFERRRWLAYLDWASTEEVLAGIGYDCGMDHALTRLSVDSDDIAEFCRHNNIVRLELFGSVVREDFSPDSDVDVLVKFALNTRVTLFQLVRLEDELTELFWRNVDLVERQAIEQSPNWMRRRSILDAAQVVYVAA